MRTQGPKAGRQHAISRRIEYLAPQPPYASVRIRAKIGHVRHPAGGVAVAVNLVHTAVSIRLITNPAADAEFRSRAECLLADGTATPTELQLRLRADYPEASVVRGIVEPGSERWYAYRDGRWINPGRAGFGASVELSRTAELRPE